MRKLLMVSLDAFFHDDVDALPPDSFLRGFLRDSLATTQVQSVFPALTYPAHVTLMTGCDPIHHGVGQNQPFQSGVPADMRVWYWDVAHVRRQTLPHAVHAAGGTVASILWPVTAHCPAIRWNFPEVLALPGENQALKIIRHGSPAWVISTELRLGRRRVSTAEPHLSDYAVLLAQDVIRRHRPDLTMVHLVDLDETRHRYGVNSPEAMDALCRMDRRVELLHRTLRETPGMEDALMVLVSDHGQQDVTRTVTLADALQGDALVQSNGMSAYLFESDRGPEGLRRAAYRLQAHAGEWGISRVLQRHQLDEAGCVSGPAFAVTAQPHVVFADGLPQAKREKATHGFAPDETPLGCLFAIHGPGIAPGALPAAPMRCVAPTVAALMGVPLPGATGASLV